jgi:CDP-diacylglycerol--glycerol-3-phosphate 3-phosphatidyltransferase
LPGEYTTTTPKYSTGNRRGVIRGFLSFIREREAYLNSQTVVGKSSSALRLSRFRKTAEYYLTYPFVQLLARTPITPNVISWFGFVLTVGAAVLVITGHLLAGGVVVLIAGFFDMLDGALARSTKQATKFGAILDSTLDRSSEAVLLISLLGVYGGQQSTVGVLLVGFTLLGSYLVSYIKARAEAMGLECEVGLFTRPERVVVLALGLFLSQIDYAFLTVAISIIAFFSFVSAGQRLFHTWRQTVK